MHAPSEKFWIYEGKRRNNTFVWLLCVWILKGERGANRQECKTENDFCQIACLQIDKLPTAILITSQSMLQIRTAVLLRRSHRSPTQKNKNWLCVGKKKEEHLCLFNVSRFDLLRCLVNAEATTFYSEIPFYFGSKRAVSPYKASNSRYPGSGL